MQEWKQPIKQKRTENAVCHIKCLKIKGLAINNCSIFIEFNEFYISFTQQTINFINNFNMGGYLILNSLFELIDKLTN